MTPTPPRQDGDMTPFFENETLTVYGGDCVDVLRTLPDASVDSVVTDPPYGLEFMGKDWDAPWREAGRGGSSSVLFGEWCAVWLAECFRVLKPGGHVLAFGGTRTSHRLACAAEDVGFEIRDSIAWLYASGFPKSMDVSKAIDRHLGATREVTREAARPNEPGETISFDQRPSTEREQRDTPATVEAAAWDGWGTALKPAFEPIIVARKPMRGTVAANVLEHGTGGLNIDGCRTGMSDDDREKYERGREAWVAHSDRKGGLRPDGSRAKANEVFGVYGTATNGPADGGRWPANVTMDEDQAAALDEASGDGRSRRGLSSAPAGHAFAGEDYDGKPGRTDPYEAGYDDEGGASRFFFTAKANGAERVRIDGVAHPTVKPLSLMRWLVRLVTPGGGTVLEPFGGSGTTAEACLLEGFRCIVAERDVTYLPLIVQRVNRRVDPVAAVKATGDDLGLFAFLSEDES